jgi:hypothetical protein
VASLVSRKRSWDVIKKVARELCLIVGGGSTVAGKLGMLFAE